MADPLSSVPTDLYACCMRVLQQHWRFWLTSSKNASTPDSPRFSEHSWEHAKSEIPWPSPYALALVALVLLQ